MMNKEQQFAKKLEEIKTLAREQGKFRKPLRSWN